MKLPAGRAIARPALFAGAAVLFLAGLGDRDLWNPNEPLYGQAVVEMAATGDRLLPTVNGESFAEKPPLYFWLALGVARVTGAVDEWSLRLPSALAGLVVVCLVYALVERYVGSRRAWIAAALSATTFSVVWSARSIQMDLLLAATTIGALSAALGRIGRRAWVAPLVAGACVGLGALAKGPVGIVCPALVLAADAAAGGEARRRIGLGWIAVAGVAAAAVAAPWYLAVAARGDSGALSELLWRQNVTRFFDPWDHAHPWWYYLEAVWLEGAPWSFVATLAWRARDSDPGARSLDRLAWIWIGTIVAFFSLSASKRGAYLLPAVPAIAILASGVLDRLGRGVLSAGRRRALWTFAGAAFALLAAGGVWVAQRAASYPEVVAPARALAAVLVAGAVAGAWTLARRNRFPLGPLVALAATVAGAYLVAGAWALPAANAYKSARGFCVAVNERVSATAPLRSYGSWKWRSGYVYYTRRRIPRLETDDALRAYFARQGEVFLVVERGALPEVRRILGEVEPILVAQVGDNAAYLFTNRGATTPEAPLDGRTRSTGGAARSRRAPRPSTARGCAACARTTSRSRRPPDTGAGSG